MEDLRKEMNKMEDDLQESMQNKQKLEIQLCENELVKSELELADDESEIYKLTGPVLLKQHCSEARSVVDKRIEYIKSEIKNISNKIESLQSMIGEAEKKASATKIATK